MQRAAERRLVESSARSSARSLPIRLARPLSARLPNQRTLRAGRLFRYPALGRRTDGHGKPVRWRGRAPAVAEPGSQVVHSRSTDGVGPAHSRPLVVGHGIDPAFDDRKAGLAVSVRASRSAHRTGTSRISPAAPSPCPSERVTHTANPVVDSTLSRSLDAAKLDTVYSYS